MRSSVRSPPTRGSVGVQHANIRSRSPLPAHAGVSRCFATNGLTPVSAPRPRGGQSRGSRRRRPRSSRSPPTRGSVDLRPVRRYRARPLPAHAGVSRRHVSSKHLPRPAPRPRGGQSLPPSRIRCRHFRSPPTRGSVVWLSYGVRSCQPLPAHAGVSRLFGFVTRSCVSAPRPRGGQSVVDACRIPHVPRSPPTRGSVGSRSDLQTRVWPLPAHAGVSRTHRRHCTPAPSAPRPRGGQSGVRRTMSARQARSPPTRGSVGCPR